MTDLDPRLHAFRPDLADIRLKGRVESARFVEAMPRRVVAAAAPIKRVPRADAGLESEALRGEAFMVFEDGAEGLVVGPSSKLTPMSAMCPPMRSVPSRPSRPTGSRRSAPSSIRAPT